MYQSTGYSGELRISQTDWRGASPKGGSANLYYFGHFPRKLQDFLLKIGTGGDTRPQRPLDPPVG